MEHRTEQNGQADQVDDSVRIGSSEEASQIGWGRSALVVAWLFLCVTALMGWMMRWHMVWPIPGLNYGNMLHGHSHTGFLGWVFNALFVFGVAGFAKEPDRRFFRRLFWVTQVPMAVMVVSFPMEGYGVLSIVVSVTERDDKVFQADTQDAHSKSVARIKKEMDKNAVRYFCSKVCKPASSRMLMPNSWALANLLPASAPATTAKVFLLTEPLTLPPAASIKACA